MSFNMFKVFLSKVMAAILFDGAEPFKQFYLRAYGGTFVYM